MGEAATAIRQGRRRRRRRAGGFAARPGTPLGFGVGLRAVDATTNCAQGRTRCSRTGFTLRRDRGDVRSCAGVRRLEHAALGETAQEFAARAGQRFLRLQIVEDVAEASPRRDTACRRCNCAGTMPRINRHDVVVLQLASVCASSGPSLVILRTTGGRGNPFLGGRGRPCRSCRGRVRRRDGSRGIRHPRPAAWGLGRRPDAEDCHPVGPLAWSRPPSAGIDAAGNRRNSLSSRMP